MTYTINGTTIKTGQSDGFGNYAIVERESQRLFTLYEVLSSKEAVTKFLHRCKLPPADGTDTEYVKKLAEKITRDVRRALPQGTFNNRMKGGPNRKTLYEQVSFGYISDRVPRSMILTVEDLGNFVAEKLYPAIDSCHDDLLTQYLTMAGRGIGTFLAGGGVCSMVSHVSLGALTHHAYDVLAAIVYSSIDHSFVIVGRPSTCWYVIDPWVGSPHACALKDCYFGYKTITHMWPLHIVNAAPTEWGQGLSEVSARQAMAHMEKTYRDASLYDSRNNPEPDHAWAHESNLAKGRAVNYGDPLLGPLDWGARVA